MYVYCINNLKQQTVEVFVVADIELHFSTTSSYCGAMHAFECAPCLLYFSVVQACVNAL